MNLRNLVATSTLAALLALPLLGQSTHVADRLADWALFWGMSGADAAAFAIASALVCGSLTGIGLVVCGITGIG